MWPIFFITPSIVTKRIDSIRLYCVHPPQKTNIADPMLIRIFLQAENTEFNFAIQAYGAKPLINGK
jgi:hypothetical protein